MAQWKEVVTVPAGRGGSSPQGKRWCITFELGLEGCGGVHQKEKEGVGREGNEGIARTRCNVFTDLELLGKR